MSEQLDRLLAAKHGVSALDARSLSTEDLTSVVGIIATLGSDMRLQAMSILTRAAPVETIGVLAGLLGSPIEDSNVRAAAAAHLGALGLAAAPALATAIAVLPQDPALAGVRQTVAAALGKVGDTDSLAALAALVGDGSPFVARQARFAQTLIAFRAGMTGFEPSPANPFDLIAPSGDDSQGILLSPTQDVLTIVESLQDAGETFGLTLGSAGAHRIQCIDFDLALLFDETVAGGLPFLATQRPVLAGVVALHHEASDTWSTRWLLLAWPTVGLVNVALHRGDGKQTAFGAGASDGTTLSFALRGVRESGNTPLQFDGQLSGDSLTILAAASAATLFSQASPEPFDL